MRNYLLLLIFILLNSSFTIPGQYKRDISEAIELLEKEQETIDRIAENYQSDKVEVLSVVFPEIIRYSRFKDFFETKALEQLYVLKGNGWADFSIGYFQMKPSFIEDLEYHVFHIQGIKNQFSELIEYNALSEESIRQERIERLKSFEWQLKYAFCYYAIMKKCYEGFEFDEEYRLRFFATAYNFGFTKSFKAIEKWMNEQAFPYGKKFNTEQFAFCELSIAFYKQYSSQLENKPSAN